MHLSAAAAKINKWAVQQSGDTLEMIERPRGGLSVVLVDGQSSGRAAKQVSMWVVRKVIADLAEGVRDGAAARAANDVLYALRDGKVSATLVILSADLASHSLVVTRCGNPEVYLREPEGGLRRLEGTAPPLGFYRHVRPLVDSLPLEPNRMLCAFTDGILHAGSRKGQALDVAATLAALWEVAPEAQAIADGLLTRALELEEQRPLDDASVAVLQVLSGAAAGPRFMRVEMPLPDDLG
ncbi:MAG: serine/threonine-protein phosphatase [Chloroflexi bacterium]|nr:serine/threonine-protein phosphatase [Chloroflexota bacterium]OQB01514.1 MAG: Stage II sporulation protein E (SpoIIE) [Chloroflexi bacterium ADurb.Bin222]HOC20866.1 PP2C family protein-serine/threonine phosphatase [Anaerolineae bacterium]HQM13325.1 PP2C family protein-serine/threonine phosphatase [Anaerolineae bacterium]